MMMMMMMMATCAFVCRILSTLWPEPDGRDREREKKNVYKIKEGGTVDRTRRNEEKPITK